MTNSERLQLAVNGTEPQALPVMILELADQGCAKQETHERLERLLLDIRKRKDHREAHEDAVLDVLDAIGGGT